MLFVFYHDNHHWLGDVAIMIRTKIVCIIVSVLCLQLNLYPALELHSYWEIIWFLVLIYVFAPCLDIASFWASCGLEWFCYGETFSRKTCRGTGNWSHLWDLCLFLSSLGRFLFLAYYSFLSSSIWKFFQ